MSQLKAVITRLSPSCRQCLQQAARLCINNGHREVDTVHLLHELIATPHNDVAQILKFNKIAQPSLSSRHDRLAEYLWSGNRLYPCV